MSQMSQTTTNSIDETTNTNNAARLNNIRETIDNMSKFNHIEILRILNKHKDIIINENKYGIHINLSELSDTILDELEMYIKYVNNQEKYLNIIEQEKENYKNTYFCKDNKEM
jgi:hypothetical protein